MPCPASSHRLAAAALARAPAARARRPPRPGGSRSRPHERRAPRRRSPRAARARSGSCWARAIDRGWRAWCDGRSLGAPEVVDGYANGWHAPASCRTVHFAFAPQRAVVWGYVASALACLLLLGLLLLRRPGPETAAVPAARTPEDAAHPAGGAAARRSHRPGRRPAAGLRVRGPLGAGDVRPGDAGPVARDRRAAADPGGGGAAGARARDLPGVHPADKGGYNTNYPVALVGAHWVAVAAVVLLGLSLWRTLRGLKPRGSPAQTPSRPASAPERPAAGVA